MVTAGKKYNKVVMQQLATQEKQSMPATAYPQTIQIYPLHHPGEDILTFFLSGKPASSQDALRPYLEKGHLRLKLSYPIDDLSKEIAQPLAILEVKTRLIFRKGRGQSLIVSESSAGDMVILSTILSVDACDEAWLATQDKPSKLSVHSVLKLRLGSDILYLENNMRLDDLLRLQGGDDRGYASSLKIVYKFFDVRAGDYLDLPARYWVDGSSRGITPSVSFAGKNRINSALVAVAPVSPAHLPLASVATAGKFDTNIRLNIIDDWAIHLSTDQLLQDLPIVNDATQDFWVNRKNDKEWLAIPEFYVVAPALDQTFQDAPFSFVFSNLGMDVDGRPVLEGAVTLTIKQRLSESVCSAAAKLDPARAIRPVTLQTSGFNLAIPYINKEQAMATFVVAASEVSSSADATRLVFRLNNAAIRICYNSIGSDPSQSGYLPLQLMMDIGFSGYTAVNQSKINWANIIHSRISAIPIVRQGPSAATGNDYFNATANRLVRRNGQEMTYRDVATRPITPIVHAAALPVATKLNNPYNSVIIRPDVHLLQTSVHHLPDKQDPVMYKIQTFHRALALDLGFPCNTYGSFYQEDNAGQYTAVGCRSAYKLGEPPQYLYSEIPELRDPMFSVYQSTLSPGQFLICPARYIIGRHSPTGDAATDHKPCILLYSTIDAVNNTSTWMLDCTLMPDIDFARRIEMEEALKQFTPYTPVIHYVTEVPAKKAEAVVSVSGMTGTSLTAYPLGKGIRITIEAKIESILILLDMLKHSSLDGTFTFTLEDGSAFSVQLAPRLDRIAGLWESGHVEETQEAGAKAMLNIGENPLVLTKIRYYKTEGYDEQSLANTLSPGSTLAFPSPPEKITRWAAYYSEQNPAEITLQQINRYIEDVKCQLIFITMMDFAANKIKDVQVSYRLKDGDTAFIAILDAANNNCEKLLLMPITNFMIQRIIEFKVSKVTLEDGSSHEATNDWIAQDLASEGNIINIQTNQITFK